MGTKVKRRLGAVLVFLALVSAVTALRWSGTAAAVGTDFVIAQMDDPYYGYFPCVVNVPKEVFAGETDGSEENGKLLVNYYYNDRHGPSALDEPRGTIMLTESVDNGVTWSEPRAAITNETIHEWGICRPGEHDYGDTCLEARVNDMKVLSDGTIIMTFFTYGDPLLDQKTYLTESKDGGETWEQAVNIPSKILSSVCRQGSIAEFTDGTLLMSLYGYKSGQPKNGLTTVTLIEGKRNDDGIWEWSDDRIFGESKSSDAILNEVALLAPDGGDIVYALGRETGEVWQSQDRGETWTVIGRQGALQQPKLLQVDDNKIFAAYVKPTIPRPVYGKMFYPEHGWDATTEKLIYQFPGGAGDGRSDYDMGNPDAVLTNDGKLLTVYYSGVTRSIRGNLSDLDEWNIPALDESLEVTGGEQRLTVFEDDFDSLEPGEQYTRSDLTITNGQLLTAGEDGQIVFKRAGGISPQMTTLNNGDHYVRGNVTLRFDFRFMQPSTGWQDVDISLQALTTTVQIKLREENLLFTQNIYTAESIVVPEPAEDGSEVPSKHTAGEWFSLRWTRSGNTHYIRSWARDEAEPTDWDIVSVDDAYKDDYGTIRFSYGTDMDGATFELDNLSVTREVNFRLSQDTLTLEKGASQRLDTTVLPVLTGLTPAVGSVQWASDNPEVASVSSDGTVTAVGVGTATVTASLKNVKATCNVTVNRPGAADSGSVEMSDGYGRWNILSDDYDYSVDPDNAQYDKQPGVSQAYRFVGPEYFTLYDGVLRMTGSGEETAIKRGEMITRQSVTGDYSLRYRFRFNDAVQAEKTEELYVSLTHGVTDLNLQVHLRQDGLLLKNNGVEKDSAAKTHGVGQWYNFRATRSGRTLFVRTWADGQAEPNEWDVIYSNDLLATAVGPVRLSYYQAGAESSMDIDDFAVSKNLRLTLSETEKTLETGGTFYLTAELTPDLTNERPIPPGVTFASSDETVAHVSAAGKVTALSAGESVITASVGNLTATCTVTVSEPVPEEPDLTPDEEDPDESTDGDPGEEPGGNSGEESGGDPSEPTDEGNKEGCGGAVAGSSALPALITVISAGLLFYRRKYSV